MNITQESTQETFGGADLQDIEDYEKTFKLIKIGIFQDIKDGFQKVLRNFVTPELIAVRYEIRINDAVEILNQLEAESILISTSGNGYVNKQLEHIYEYNIAPKQATLELNKLLSR